MFIKSHSHQSTPLKTLECLLYAILWRHLVIAFFGSTDNHLQDLSAGFICQRLYFYDGKVIYSFGDKNLVMDAALISSTFSLLASEIVDFSVISKEDMVAALKNLYDSGEYLSPSCFNKLLNMEFQFLTDIVAC